MKRTLLIALSCCLALVLTFGLASCAKECEHTYDNACDVTCNECGETREASDHVYDNVCDVACNECNKTRLIKHDYSVWQSDDTNHWKACSVCEREDGENKAKHVYDNDCDTSCNTCEKTRITEHSPEEDDGDCTTEITCFACGEVVTEARSEHTGGTATCTHGKLCEVCGYEYSAKVSDNHESDVYAYTDNGDGTHTKAHECGVAVSEPENHTIIDGTCACGQSDYVYDEATNTYSVYSNDFFQTAINDAKISGTAENPATIKLMADIEATGVLNEYGFVEQDVLIDNGVITLDLNGYTLTGMSGNRVIKVTNGANLTIDDSSENKSGKVVGLENDEYYIYTLNVDGGNLVVNNGNFEGRRAVWGG